MPLRSSTRYRSDIDGLRAVAVLAVFAFHLGLLRIARGGFVGVDTFFVISGYLITGIIIAQIQSSTFSLSTFYRRRALRILPALAVMICGVALGTLLLLPPIETVAFGKSTAAAGLSMSNVLFYFSPNGYFFDEVHARPLLHTWSLGIEEQFYFIFPLVLIATFKVAPKHLTAVIAAIGLASLAVSILTLRSNPSAAFFLLPARFWELMLGSAAALKIVRLPKGYFWAELAGAGGLIMILFAIVTTDSTYLSPYWALVPCAGATLVLLSGERHETFVRKLLSVKPLVWIGLISYSLYLWHWPIIVFIHFGLAEPLSSSNRLIIVTISFAIAIASWWKIEQPFRNLPKTIRNRSILGTAAATMAIIAILGVGLVRAKGFPDRFSPDADRVSAYLDDPQVASEFAREAVFVTTPNEHFDWRHCLGALKPVINGLYFSGIATPRTYGPASRVLPRRKT